MPSFLLKTYEIVNDPSSDDIVRWNETGDSFIIMKTHEFCEELLPVYFKHKNLSSFVRQLNMYGFHKTKLKNNEQCFVHKYFRRDNKGLLLKITRKTKKSVSSKKSDKEGEVSATIVELSKIIKNQQHKLKEQERKIDKLYKANKDFRNSIFALYTELEKQKSNKVEYSDLVKLFKNLSAPNSNNGLNNLFYVDGNNLNGNNQKFYEMDLSNAINAPMKAIQGEDVKKSGRRRDVKKLRSPSPGLSDTWKQVAGVGSRPASPTSKLQKDFAADNISAFSNKNDEILGEKNPMLISRRNSIISDFDSFKGGKNDDDIYADSHPGYGQLQLTNEPHIDKPIALNYDEEMQNGENFDELSNTPKNELSELRSISEFSANNDGVLGPISHPNH